MGNQKQRAAAANATLEGENGFSLISNDTLITLYANLLKARLLEERALALVKADVDSKSEAGREAAIVGVSLDLVPEDTVRSANDGIVARYLTGMSLKSIFNSLRGQAGNEEGLALRLHSVLGAAIAHKTSKSGKVAVVFWNGAAADQWQNALDSARAHGLPIIFVCHVDAARAKVAVRSRSKKTAAIADELGLPIITVDGNDVVAVYRVAHESIGRARLGRGPTLIQCGVFRPMGKGRFANSVASMETYLRSTGLLKRGIKNEIIEAFMQELDKAITTRRR
jgi:TPP-dependent pyruvate/acetoin dehydrogenase alpha subunit